MTTDEKLQEICVNSGITYSSIYQYEQGFAEVAIDAVISHSLTPEMENAVLDVFGWQVFRDKRLENALNRLAAALEAKV